MRAFALVRDHFDAVPLARWPFIIFCLDNAGIFGGFCPATIKPDRYTIDEPEIPAVALLHLALDRTGPYFVSFNNMV